MKLFDHPEFEGHEEVRFVHDRETGLRAIIAIHDTTLGPAIGGCRMWPYGSEGEAVTDVLRLAKAMTWKAAMAGLALGGGKSVIIGDPKRDKTKALFRAFGRAVEAMGGRFYTGEDVGTAPEDMAEAGRETRYVLGRPGAGSSGDPSPFTARGVLMGMEVALEQALGRRGFEGIRVALQGLGHVGMELARLLSARGARLVVADIDRARTARAARALGAVAVEADAIHRVEAEIFSPCALGGVLNDDTIPELGCRIVAGSANNQLAAARHGRLLHERGILYAPDYVINAGGLINIAGELRPEGYDRRRALAALTVIPRRLEEIFRRARESGLPAHEVADRMAREIVEGARHRRAA